MCFGVLTNMNLHHVRPTKEEKKIPFAMILFIFKI